MPTTIDATSPAASSGKSPGPAGATPTDAAAASTDPYAAWRHPAYRRFLSGRALFLVGHHMQSAAVGWQIYERFGSKLALGYVGLVQILPVLFLALPAGHLADHFDRRFIIRAGLIGFALGSLALIAASVLHAPRGFLYGNLFFVAMARILTVPAMGSLLPTVIPKHLWTNAATWNSSLFELMALGGPALAGGLIAASGGATAVYGAAVLCALISMLLFSRLPAPERTGTLRRAPTWRDALSGVRFVFRTRLLLAAASLDLFAVLFGGVTALLPVVAKDILHTGPEGFGWLRAAPSFGAAGMAIVTAHLAPWRRAGRVLFLAFVGFGAAIVVFGLSRNYWLSFAMLVLTGVFDNLNVVIRQTLVQYITPDEMRGRVTAVNFIFIGCSNELGAFESGLAAHHLGTVPAIVFGGIMTIAVVALIMGRSPALRRLGPVREILPAPVSP